MTLERDLVDALRLADDYEPSPDLFEKVQRSIAEDADHRRRVRRVVAGAIGTLAAVAVIIGFTAEVRAGGVWVPFLVVEGLTTGVMLIVVLVVGPSIRRFGAWFERAAFRAAPDTGERFLRLIDLAYYLVFGGYLVVTLQFEPSGAWGPVDEVGAWVGGQVERLAGLVLLMGLLHVGLLLSIPVAGLVVSANLWRARAGRGPANPAAATVDRAISAVVATLVGLALLGLALLVITLVLVGLSGP